MAIYHNYIVVIGRIPGDDECTLIRFEQMTNDEARRAFADEIYQMAYSYEQDDAVRTAAIAEARAHDIACNDNDDDGLGVFIDYVLTSQSPIDEV